MKIADVAVRGAKNSNLSPAKSGSLWWSAAIAFITLIGGQPSVQAANFNFTYASGTSLEQMLGFEMAGLLWSDYLTDDATLNIFVESTNMLPDKVIGGALPGIMPQVEYSTYRRHFSADITSVEDQTAFYNLQTNQAEARFSVRVNHHRLKGNQTLNLNRANAKAIGILDGADAGLDGYILMSDLADESVAWNYDLSNSTVPNGTLDYLSVALHEVGHTLGFVSGVDSPAWLNTLTGLEGATQEDYDKLKGSLTHINGLDLFRYNGKQANFIDLSSGGRPFFSIDGGETNLANFASGQDMSLGGDGYQASHWRQKDNHLGIMDPVLAVDQRREISDLDKLAMDVLGWDLQAGGTDLATLNSQAKAVLAEKMGVDCRVDGGKSR